MREKKLISRYNERSLRFYFCVIKILIDVSMNNIEYVIHVISANM